MGTQDGFWLRRHISKGLAAEKGQFDHVLSTYQVGKQWKVTAKKNIYLHHSISFILTLGKIKFHSAIKSFELFSFSKRA